MVSTASISAHKKFILRVNPYDISWGYNLRTHVDDTYGGKVVQILGVDLTTLNVNTVAGAGGLDYIQSLATFWKDMCLWQQNEQKLATFTFAAKNYRLNVWAQNLTYNDSVDNVVYPVDMSFAIQEDLAGTLTKTAMTDQLKKLATGVGYVRNDFNYPSQSAQAELQSKLNSIAAPGGNTPTNISNVSGTDSSLDAAQQANAQIIIGVALSIFPGNDGKLAAIIGVMAALAESEMKSINYGDAPGGNPSSSRGIFQQLSAWGPLADRLDPTKTTTMFFTGGQAGQHGLKDITGWQNLTPWAAAQAVQQSEFSDGSNYHARYDKAVSIVNNIMNSSATTNTSIYSDSATDLVIPAKANVAAGAQNQTIHCSVASIGKGVSAGLAMIGVPYVYGGGTAGGGPDNGQSRAGGAENSGGSLVGFDCSGLTMYVLKQAGFTIPDNSDGQRSGGTKIPFASKAPGDIIGYSGHVAIFLGTFGGTDYLLEAPDVGMFVQVRDVYPTNHGIPHDDVVYRYWS